MSDWEKKEILYIFYLLETMEVNPPSLAVPVAPVFSI